jgi:hypothetical protein
LKILRAPVFAAGRERKIDTEIGSLRRSSASRRPPEGLDIRHRDFNVISPVFAENCGRFIGQLPDAGGK